MGHHAGGRVGEIADVAALEIDALAAASVSHAQRQVLRHTTGDEKRSEQRHARKTSVEFHIRFQTASTRIARKQSKNRHLGGLPVKNRLGGQRKRGDTPAGVVSVAGSAEGRSVPPYSFV